jgi:hypothetical protein
MIFAFENRPYLGEFDAEFKKALVRESGDQGVLFDEKKTLGRKSRDTVPLLKPPLSLTDLPPHRIPIWHPVMSAVNTGSSLPDTWNPEHQLFWHPECSFHTLLGLVEDWPTVNIGIRCTNRCTLENSYWLLL